MKGNRMCHYQIKYQLLLQWWLFSKGYIKYMELHYHYEVTIKLFYIMLLLILVLHTSVGHAFWKPQFTACGWRAPWFPKSLSSIVTATGHLSHFLIGLNTSWQGHSDNVLLVWSLNYLPAPTSLCLLHLKSYSLLAKSWWQGQGDPCCLFTQLFRDELVHSSHPLPACIFLRLSHLFHLTPIYI